jgi:hypothetical protein
MITKIMLEMPRWRSPISIQTLQRNTKAGPGGVRVSRAITVSCRRSSRRLNLLWTCVCSGSQ